MMSSYSDLKVGIVDDSPLIRKIIKTVIENTPGMCVAGVAADPLEAREMIKSVDPDVITLDIEMPKMNGIEFLEKIMKLRPMPVIMVSTLTQKGADATLTALEMGAVDYVGKPAITQANDDIVSFFTAELVPKLRSVKYTNFSNNVARFQVNKTSAEVNVSNDGVINAYDIITLASSTGGIERLRYLLSNLTVNIPPLLIVQHINQMYVENMVERMQQISPAHIFVKTANHGEKLKENTIYFADNNAHLEVRMKGDSLYAFLQDSDPLNGFKASADYLFKSVASINGLNNLGVILSGLGHDGAQGMLSLKNSGADTIGESEDSCLVYGMSRAAFEAGGIGRELSIEAISGLLSR